jgi:hypothetical protein
MTRSSVYRELAGKKRFRRYRCRCTRCEHRRTFRDHPSQIVRPPKCSGCGSSSWRVDWYRTTRREHRKVICHCGGRPFPHRTGRTSCNPSMYYRPAMAA